MKEKRKTLLVRIIFIAVGLLLFYVIGSICFSAIFYSVMFGRKDVDPASLEQTYTEADAKAYPRRELSFPSGENELHGWLYSPDRPEGIVVIAHGIGGGADTHLAEIFWFVDHGWSVLAFDGTGFRESEGDGMRGLSQMRLDVLAACSCLDSDPDLTDLPVVLYGHSMGGYAVAACLSDDPDVEAVVSISGFDSPVGLMYGTAQKYVGFLAVFGAPFLSLQNAMVFGNEGDLHASCVLSETQVPVLLVYGSSDDIVPEDLSIYGQRDRIDNDRVSCLLVTEAPRNEHSTIWLSAGAASYLLRSREEADRLENDPRALSEYRESFREDRAYALDEAFMKETLRFYRKAVR